MNKLTWFWSFMKINLDPIFKPLRQTHESIQRIIHVITSRKALRSYIYVVIGLITNLVLVITAISLYLIVYQLYIPLESVKVPIHLDYSAVSDTVYAVTDIFDNSPLHHSRLPNFKPGVSYEIWLNLKVPYTDYNRQLGNFMQKITLIDDLESFREVNALTLPRIKKSLYQPSRWPLSHFDYYSLQPGIKFLPLPDANSLKFSHEQKEGTSRRNVIKAARGGTETPAAAGDGKMMLTSVKPGSIRHYSDLLYNLQTLAYWPLYISGLYDQCDTVSSHMISGWRLSPYATTQNPHSLSTKTYGEFNTEGSFSFNRAKWIITEFDRVVNVHEAELEWRVQWEGVRYWMQRHKLMTAILAIGSFWFIEAVTVLIVVIGFAIYFSDEEEEEEEDKNNNRNKSKSSRSRPQTALRRGSNLDGIEPLSSGSRALNGDDLDDDEDPDMVVFERVFHEDEDHHAPIDDIDFNHGYRPFMTRRRRGSGSGKYEVGTELDGAWSSGMSRDREDPGWFDLATPETTPAPEAEETGNENETETESHSEESPSEESPSEESPSEESPSEETPSDSEVSVSLEAPTASTDELTTHSSELESGSLASRISITPGTTPSLEGIKES